MGSNTLNQSNHPPASVGMMNSQQSHLNTAAQSQTANGTLKREGNDGSMADNTLRSPAGMSCG